MVSMAVSGCQFDSQPCVDSQPCNPFPIGRRGVARYRTGNSGDIRLISTRPRGNAAKVGATPDGMAQVGRD